MLKLFPRRATPVITDKKKIVELLTRGVEDVFVKESLEKKLLSGKRLRVKLGFDPTGEKIHIGNAVILRKLKAFQDLGHNILFIIGDFTAKIGDPSDKLERRPMLSDAEIAKNLATYKKQVGKIIDLKRATFYYNSSWLGKLKFDEISRLAETFSVQQMSARRNFKERFEKGIEISLREFLYPLMQGYDSVVVGADVEIGGFDQLFNLKAGRIIQKQYGMAEQDVLTTKMLVGTDGRKMSKSWGNVIDIDDEPTDMFGKVMSLRDDLLGWYFLLCTDMPADEAAKIGERIEQGENPRDIKLELGEKIVSLYWGTSAAAKARKNFIEIFSQGKVPEEVENLAVKPGALLVDALLSQKIIESKSEWRRLVSEGAVMSMDTGARISDPQLEAAGGTYKIGKRRFVKIVMQS